MKQLSPGLRYRLLAMPLYAFWILHAIRHGRKHRRKSYLRLRRRGFDSASEDQVWVHASSIGEVRGATPLVRALLREGEKVLFTSFTASGLQAIESEFGDSLASGVIPIDNRRHCRRFFRRHRIKIGLVMETELWPELLYQARRRHIRLLQVNARLSARSLEAGVFVRQMLANTLAYFDRFLTRNKQDRAALVSFGVDPRNIEIAGNLKTRTDLSQEYPRLIERDYLLLASSHAGEEQRFLESRCALDGDPLLVLAPRHPERGASIRVQLDRLDLRYAVRSEGQDIEADTQVYLADTLGELMPLMAYAEIVIMGGSFDSTGGHNLIEPASLARAIITGPSDANIAEDIELLGPGAGLLQVADMAECWKRIVELRKDPETARKLGQQARERLARQPDVVERYMEIIRPYL